MFASMEIMFRSMEFIFTSVELIALQNHSKHLYKGQVPKSIAGTVMYMAAAPRLCNNNLYAQAAAPALVWASHVHTCLCLFLFPIKLAFVKARQEHKD